MNMTANSSQADAQENYAQENYASTDDEIVHLYGSTKESPPLQVDKLRDVAAERTSEPKADASECDHHHDHDGQYIQLKEQENPLLKTNDDKRRSNRRQLLSTFDVPVSESHQSLSPWSSQADVSIRSTNCGWLKHPRIQENWKIVLGSFVLTLLGLILFLTGIIVAASPARGVHCLVFFIIGFLCFVPGLYHLIYMYYAVIGKPGYSFYNLPVLK